MGAYPLSVWAERRPQRSEADRSHIADSYALHLPPAPMGLISDADIDAMRAAFIRRYDEDLPRTETLMAVAAIGYRMALRDMRKDQPHD